MRIAVVGLGKMGHQIAARLVEDSHEVIALDRSSELIVSAQSVGAIAANSRDDVLLKFEDSKPVIWLMIPASAVDEEIQGWKTILPQQSILIDGGNSEFQLSKQRAEMLETSNINFLDVGTSGGILGLKNGFSMMIGGKQDVFKQIEPILVSLSKPNGAYHYFGSSGAGHYVKMIHNAIEYGMMESLAEGYELLKEGSYPTLDLGAVANVWQHGSIVASSLNELAGEILSENPGLEGFEGVVAESGEAEWSLELAKSLGIKMPGIQAAYDTRIESERGEVSYSTKLLAALRNKFGGHNPNPKV